MYNTSVPIHMEYKIPQEIVLVGLGTAGGIVRVFFSYLNDPAPPTGLRFFVVLSMNMFISGFSGYLGAVIGSTISDNVKWVIICSGIAGYMGVTFLEYAAKQVQDKIKL